MTKQSASPFVSLQARILSVIHNTPNTLYIILNTIKILRLPRAPIVIALIFITLIATFTPNSTLALNQVNTTKSSTADFDLGTNNNLATTSDELKMTPNPRTAWYQTGGTWNYRKKVVIDHTKVPNTDQTDFPVLINLASDSDLAAKAQDDGDDLLLTQEDQTTKLSHEIESFNGTTGALVLWVKIPLLSHTYDTTIYLYYGNAAATNQQNATAVWSNGYAGVWHMDETSGDLTDSTSYINNVSQVGSPTRATVSKIGSGITLPTTGDYFTRQLTDSLKNVTSLTLSSWVKTDNFSNQFGGLQATDSGGYTIYLLNLRWGVLNQHVRHAGYQLNRAAASSAIPSNQWTLLTGVLDTSTDQIKIYANGSPLNSSPVIPWDGTIAVPSSGNFNISTFAPGGSQDESRVSSVARSADWIATEYANQNDPGTFYSLQSETAKTSVNIASNNISTDWYHTDWKYRRQITIDHTKVPNTDQSEFPMLVKIADSTDPIFTKAQADGDDILFTNIYGNTKLSHEIETFNTTTKELWAWVKIPTLSTSTDTTIWLYYGNSGATNQQSVTDVWSNGYAGVWHMDDNAANTNVADSLGANNGTAQANTNTKTITGKTGNALNFNGSSDYINTGDLATIEETSKLTVTGWVNQNTLVSEAGVFAKTDASTCLDMLNWGTSGNVFVRVGTGDGYGVTTSAPISTGTWGKWTMIFDGTQSGTDRLKFRFNGQNVALSYTGIPNATIMANAVNTNIGRYTYGNYKINGVIDNLSVIKNAVSPDWDATEYNNQNSPETFASISKETGYYPSAGTANWYSTGGTWTARQAVTIDHTKVPNTDQTDFPVLIKITNQSNGVFAGAQADGDDIVFTSSDGKTKLSHEIETYDGATAGSKALWAWVKVPTLTTATDTVLYMYYGNAAATSQQNATDVWSNGYAAVWHMDEASGNLADSTNYARTSNSNGGVTGANGKLSGGSIFDGAGDYYATSSQFVPPNGAFTAQVWAKPNAVGTSMNISEFMDSYSGGTHDRSIFIDGNLKPSFYVYSSGLKIITGATSVQAGSWYLLSATISPSIGGKLYVNGISEGGTISSMTNGWNSYSTVYNFIGAKSGGTSGTNDFNGILDEVRISSTTRSADWIATEYNNQNSPETFESFGMEQSNVSYASPTATTAGSGIIDTTWNGGWGTPNGFSSTVTIPSNTSIKYQMRSSAVGGATDSDWTAWSDLGTATSTGTFSVSTASMPAAVTLGTNRYLQVRALISSDGTSTPTLADYSIYYLADTTAPTNPSTTTLTIGGTAQTTSTWTSTSGAVVATFSGSSDGGASESGLAGYYVYFGTSDSADPLTLGTYQAHTGAVGDNQTFSSSISTADDGKYYFLRIKTKDIAGNISNALTAFQFGYDISAPSRPTFISASPAGYTTNNSFDFTWPAGADIKTAGGWYSSSWSSRQLVTFDHTKVPNTDQTDFPVLVKITDASNELFTTSQADGDDILFTSQNGTTKLSHEIEKYDASAKELWAWVKLPLLSHETDTKIYMYYGNAAATNQQNATDVWSNGYAGVWHMGESSGTFADSTGNGNTGSDGATHGVLGKMGGAASFNGTNQSINVGHGATLQPTNITVSAWANITQTPGVENYYSILGHTQYGSAYWLNAYAGPTGDRRNPMFKPTATYAGAISSNNALSFDSYGYVNGTYDGTQTKIYLDNNAPQSADYSGGMVQSNLDVIIGATFQYFKGKIDEVRISSTARSADWIATEYANQNSPETFMSVSASNGGSDIKWYEYKRATDGAWSHTADASTRTVSGLTAYQEGANAFYVRSVDNAGNVSSNYQQVTYYYSGVAPDKPTGLEVSPDTSDSNSFTIHWHRPTVDPEDPPVKGYRYSINAAPTMNNTTYVENSSDTVTIGPDAFATLQGTNTIYVLSVNEAGNYSLEDAFIASKTFTCQTPAQPAPVQVSLTDSSDSNLSRWMLTLQWAAGSGQTDAFDHYVIYRSTDGQGFSELATTSSTAYIDASSLNNQTTYYYNIKAVDSAGKQSAQSTTVSKTPTGKYLTPPSYLNTPAISNIKSSSSTISWITDRSSTSIVRYGKSTNDLDASSGQMDSVTSHEVELTGLDAGSTYYFQVQSLDEHRDYSPSLAYSTSYSFQTSDAPTISNVEVGNTTLTSADISWETTTVSNSSLYYGENSSFASKVDDVSGSSATKHSVKLSDLTHSTKYAFKITATDIEGNELVSDNYNFETLPMPRVENLKTTLIQDKARPGAKITWNTNVDTSSIVKYSVDGKDPKEETKSKLQKDHEVIIENLQDQANYKIEVSGRDSLGNLAQSTTATLITPNDQRPPVILEVSIETSNVGLNKEDKAQAVISWTTDEPATSRVEYGVGLGGENYEKMTSEDTNLSTSHVVIISDLDPSSPYHIRINSKDGSGNLASSEDQAIISSEVQKSTLRILLDALTKAFSWIRIWRK